MSTPPLEISEKGQIPLITHLPAGRQEWPYGHGQLYKKDLEEGLEWKKVDHSIFGLINRFPHGLRGNFFPAYYPTPILLESECDRRSSLQTALHLDVPSLILHDSLGEGQS